MNIRIISRKLVCFLFLIMLGSLGACAPPTKPPGTVPTAVPSPGLRPTSASLSSQTDWQKWLAGGKEEGAVIVYSTVGGEARAEIARNFSQKFGISMEVIAGKGPELVAKLSKERAAGIFYADVYMAGPTTFMTDLKPAGMLDPLLPVLILPEVTDGKAWWRGELDWLDKDKTALAFSAQVNSPIAINTEIVTKEDLKSYRDLLNPRWKGKISINDPTIAGAGSYLMVIAAQITGMDFIRELAEMEPVIVRDQRLQVEWLARGRFPIAVQPEIDVRDPRIKYAMAYHEEDSEKMLEYYKIAREVFGPLMK